MQSFLFFKSSFWNILTKLLAFQRAKKNTDWIEQNDVSAKNFLSHFQFRFRRIQLSSLRSSEIYQLHPTYNFELRSEVHEDLKNGKNRGKNLLIFILSVFYDPLCLLNITWKFEVNGTFISWDMSFFGYHRN